MWLQREENLIKYIENVLDAAERKSYPSDLENLQPLYFMSISMEGLKVIFFKYLCKTKKNFSYKY